MYLQFFNKFTSESPCFPMANGLFSSILVPGVLGVRGCEGVSPPRNSGICHHHGRTIATKGPRSAEVVCLKTVINDNNDN